MFITFEGLDGSGKTTQATLLVERLKADKHKVVFLREPGGTIVSEKIREILLDKKHLDITQTAELFLFSAARAQLVGQVIVPSLAEGKIVVCDRFYDSTTAYQGFGRELSIEHIRHINALATNGTTPDITLFVDVDVDEIQRRRREAPDRMESSGTSFYHRVREGYRTIASEEPGRIVMIDGMKPIPDIEQEIWKIIKQRLS